MQQLLDVVEMQPGGGLVQDVEGLAGGTLGELARQLHALRLTARERGGILAEAHVRQADVGERLELPGRGRHVLEEARGILDGHVEHFVDVLAAVADLERLAVITLAAAHVTRHVHVRQEVHFHADHAVTLAGLAASALDVEAETAGIVAAGAGLGHGGEQLAQRREQPGVGRRVGARRAPDRTLVDVDDAVDLLQALDALAGRGFDARAVQVRGGVAEQRVDDERRLARAGNAGDAAEQTQWDLCGHLREVVAVRADDADLPRRIRADAQAGHFDAASAREVLAGDRGGVGGDVARCALRHQVSAMRARARPQVHDMVGLPDRLLVVLDHDHRVAEVAQLLERRQEPAVVALVQADRGLIEDVHDAGEPGSDLAGKANALRFPTRERLGAAIERQIVEAHVAEEAQALHHALDDLRRHFTAPAGEGELTQELERPSDGESGKLRKSASGDEHEARRAVQARALALRARAHSQVARQLLAHHR